MALPAKEKRVLVTAGLPYSNGRLHQGHIGGAYLPSDTWVRFLRMKGRNVRFVCGSDDYGVAIMLTAEKEGKTPAEVAAFYRESQRKAFSGMGISFDIYGGTSSNKQHIKLSQEFFLSMHKLGLFEKERSRQFYDPHKKIFLPDRFVKGECGYCAAPDQNGDQCENCGKMLDVDTLKNARSVFNQKPAEVRESAHWYLDLSHFETKVKEWLATAQVRDGTRTYVEGLLSTGLVRRAMTRDITWGVPVPLEDPDAQGKVLYVWFDAPIGYVSNTAALCEQLDGDPDKYKEWWQSPNTDVFHFIGEDNTIFHCVVWIAVLLGQEKYSLPKGVIVNNFINFQAPGQTEVTKVSKSRGTAIWIEDYLAEGKNPDALRYYLTMIAPERARTTFKPDDLVQRHDSELANVLGNFVNRVMSFCAKYYGAAVPAITAAKETPVDGAFTAQFATVHGKVEELISDYQFKSALETVMEFVRAGNRYVDEKAPWTTRKTDEELTKNTLAHCLQAIKLIGVLLSPFLPFTAEKILQAYGISKPKWEDGVAVLATGTPFSTPPILFTKMAVEPAGAEKK